MGVTMAIDTERVWCVVAIVAILLLAVAFVASLGCSFHSLLCVHMPGSDHEQDKTTLILPAEPEEKPPETIIVVPEAEP
jgi:hypothetical protein